MATSAINSLPLGRVMPSFELIDVVTRNKVLSKEYQKNFATGIVVVFLCRHCPYVKHLLPSMIDVAHRFLSQGIGFLGISSNDPLDYPEDSPEQLCEMVLEKQVPFPILFDETQEVARAFEASCTPDFFVFNADCQLAYHGRFDGSTHKNGVPATGEDLQQALRAILEGGTPAVCLPSLGCSIKWKE